MTTNLIRNIATKNYDEANKNISESVILIMEKKLFEMKKFVAAKMCEQMGLMGPSRAEKLRTGVLEEDEIEEAVDPKEDSISVERGTPQPPKNTTVIPKNNMGGPGSTHYKNMKEEEHLDEMQIGKSSGMSNMARDMRLSQEPKWNESNPKLRGYYNAEPRIPNADPHAFRSNTPVYSVVPNKQVIAKYIKPNLEEETEEQLDEINLPTVNYQGGSGSSSIYTRSTKNPFSRGTEVLADKMKLNVGGTTQTFKQKTTINNLGNNSQSVKSSSSTSTMNEKTEEQLDEARVKIVKARIRGGKIQRRKKVSNVEGYKVQGGQLKRMSPVEKRNRKLGQRRGKIKRRSKLTRTLMKRQKSLRKRQSLGI